MSAREPEDVVASTIARTDDIALALALFAIDPPRLGGVVIRSGPGPHRDALVASLRALLPSHAPVLRIPSHVTDDRLLGGLALAETLREGRPVTEVGLLARADGGAVVVPSAERTTTSIAAHLGTALDRGEITIARDGLTETARARLGVVLLDEGLEDERPPASLEDRLALRIDLGALDPRVELSGPSTEACARVARARTRLRDVRVPDEIVTALVHASEALGVPSARAAILASAVARAHAALEGSVVADEDDARVAARLVLGPRATRLPAPEDDSPPPDETKDEDTRDDDARDDDSPSEGEPRPLDDIVVEAARSGIPEGLLEAIAMGRAPRSGPRSAASRSGQKKDAERGGRRVGTRARAPRSGERLDVVETLRAAAPWQRIRLRDLGDPRLLGRRRVLVRKEDLRVARHEQRTETSIIFAVDASGSAALQRLAEAKGAVEQVLVDCYARRDHVALVAFRGRAAALLLPETRSLARVRRCLSELAGGGATPLASGLDAALTLALAARKRGRTPVVVVMTDGRANVTRDGREGSAPAAEDALAIARLIRTSDVRTLFLDTSPRPRREARAVAEAMGARYLPLPYIDAAGISRTVRAIAGE